MIQNRCFCKASAKSDHITIVQLFYDYHKHQIPPESYRELIGVLFYPPCIAVIEGGSL